MIIKEQPEERKRHKTMMIMMMINLVIVNPSLAPLVDTRTPISPIPLGVITWPRTTAARLKCQTFSPRTAIILLG